MTERPPSPGRLLTTAAFLGDRGVQGYVWLDADLLPVERFGAFVEEIAFDAPIAESLVALLGFDDAIRALRTAPDSFVSIPSVKLHGAAGETERLNYVVYWMPDEQLYLLLVARAVAGNELQNAYLTESRLRRMAEAEVAAQSEIIKRQNHELAVANHDLEEFAYVISHDLRAPLRGLRYAATDAREALATGDREASGDHLVRVIERARRMSAMLTGLLEYARIGRKIDVAADLDTRALADEIAASAGEGSGIAVEVRGAWPVIRTIAEPLDIVLRNLVDNAVKHHDRDEGLIVLEAEDLGEALAMTIADDGPGIPPEWQTAVFEPFKQIADADEATGAGIGLALVKKTVERFGGAIEIRSDPAVRRGTVFRVVWPKLAPA